MASSKEVSTVLAKVNFPIYAAEMLTSRFVKWKNLQLSIY